MYVSVSNIAFNLSLVYLYVGDYDDTYEVELMVFDAVFDDLWHLDIDLSDDMTHVETGYTSESSCVFINVNFTLTIRHVIEDLDEAAVEQIVAYVLNMTHPKYYPMPHNSSLERMKNIHNCSGCTMNTSANICSSSLSSVSFNSDEAFIRRKADYTCPYLVLSKEEYDNLTLREIISSSAKSIQSLNDYFVCVEDLKFYVSTEARSNYLIETYLTYSCFGFSTLCTMGFLVVFYITPSMQTLPVKTIAHLVGCLFLAQSTYISSIGANDNELFCYLASIVQHYLWVCTYAWSSICAHHMCKVFQHIQKPQYVTTIRYVVYCCFGYITPLVFVTVFVIGDSCNCYPMEVMYGGKICFLNAGKLYGLDTPIIAMLIANLVYFGIIVYCIHTKTITSNQKVSGARTSSFLLYVKISTVMGFSWLFGMLAKWTGVYVMWIIFTVINGLQGTFVFLVFTCRRDVIVAIRQKGTHGNKNVSRSSRNTTNDDQL